MAIWNPWHGCHKLSAGCKNCFVYSGDARRGVDSSIVRQTKNFDLPIKKKRNGEYKIPSGTEVATAFTSDFFVEEADEWRAEAWKMIRERSDLTFLMLTKRIDRFHIALPDDWGEGYEHVTICCTIENQDRADYRLPIYKEAPIKHKIIICQPLLERIDLQVYDICTWVEQVVVGGESGYNARVCDLEWVLEIRQLCIDNNVSFWFKQTGAKLMKDGKVYTLKKGLQHSQARKADLNIKQKTSNTLSNNSATQKTTIQAMDFKTKLSSRIGMDDIHEITYLTQNNDKEKQKLYDLLFDKEDMIAYQAAWVLTHFSLHQNEWLYSKQDELIEELFVCQHAGKRRLLLSLLYRQPLAEPPRVDFLDYCLEKMMSQKELPWTRALCIKLAYELCRQIPELLQELRAMLEIMEPSLLTSAQRGVRENVLKAMNTRKSLQLY